jgi:hypothetical protein
MERFVFLCALLLAFAAPAAVFAEGKRPMTVDDIFRFNASATRKSAPTARPSPTSSPRWT